MSAHPLLSKSNPLIDRAVCCRDGKNKDQFFVEGITLLEEALSSSLTPTEIFCTKEKEQSVRQTLKLSHAPSSRVHLLDEKLLKFISDLDTPPGIVALVKRPIPSMKLDLTLVPLILVLHRVQLPQNVGALMRTAEATGVTHIWTTQQTADPYSPKTIRGSSGSLFRMKIRSLLTLPDVVQELQEEGFNVLAAAQGGKLRVDQVNWKEKSALVVGNEGAGFTPEELRLMRSTVNIPMAGKIESLNVSIAGSVCLYEAFRQRGYPSHGA